MITNIVWVDGTETTQRWFTLFPWEVIKKARDRYVFQYSRIASITVVDGETMLFSIDNTMQADEIFARREAAETTYRTELAAFNERYGLED